MVTNLTHPMSLELQNTELNIYACVETTRNKDICVVQPELQIS